jgi:hypothetical protein
MLAVLLTNGCAQSSGPSAPSPSASTFAAEPTRPPDCPASYPDPKAYSESAYVGTGTIVKILDGTRFNATVDVAADHPFAGRTLLLVLHGSAKLPGGAADLIAYGLRPGDRVKLTVWKFIPEDCSYSVNRLEKA